MRCLQGKAHDDPVDPRKMWTLPLEMCDDWSEGLSLFFSSWQSQGSHEQNRHVITHYRQQFPGASGTPLDSEAL